MIFPVEIKERLKFIIQKTERLSGGDISEVFKIKTDKGIFVLKLFSADQQPLAEAEIHGLEKLRKTGIFRIPEVYDSGTYSAGCFILMEFIEAGSPSHKTFNCFGEHLAKLHAVTQKDFGLDQDNFIGCLPQRNGLMKDWCEFYATMRIRPQIELAVMHGYLNLNELPETDKISSVCKNIFSETPPSLLHGDLWNGNFLIDKKGEIVLIDPSVYFGHPVMDIGMSRLFGGFPVEFYRSYFQNNGIEGDLFAQIDLAQLYYLLVHLNLFGNSYKSKVLNIFNRYF